MRYFTWTEVEGPTHPGTGPPAQGRRTPGTGPPAQGRRTPPRRRARRAP
jgi:hypothetical protein